MNSANFSVRKKRVPVSVRLFRGTLSSFKKLFSFKKQWMLPPKHFSAGGHNVKLNIKIV